MFICYSSRIYVPDLSLGILETLIDVCFRDILQPAFYQFVPGMIRLSASWYSECTVFTVNLCYLQVLAMYKKVVTYIVMCDSRIFWKKSPSGKNDQKWSKMTQKHGFWTF